MLEEYGLELGSKVDIQRSDGRVHGAVISSCNADTKTVSVQWVENNETKGKEIDFNTLVRINKLQRKTPQQQQQQKQQPQSISASSKKPLNPSSHNSPASQRPASPKKPSSAMGGRRQTNIKSSSVQQQPAAPFSVKERDHSNLSKADRKVAQMIDECRARFNPRPFSTAQAVYTDKITVCVRKRPLGKKENNNNEIDCITAPDGQLTVVHEPKEKVDLTKYIENHEFRFDYSFDEACDNAIVYKYTAAPLVRTIFDRGMATCFAYGQTGSGKTYTMGGLGSGVEGIYAMAAKDVFALNAQRGADQLTVSVSFFEIYGGKVYDLLNKQKRLRVLEDGKNQVRVVGLSEKVVETIGQVQELLAIGSRARATGTTSANAASSRSHAVLQIILREPQGRRKMHGQFSLIDLAGNERGADTASADRRTRMEGAEINKSLLALKECIRALGRRGAHTPFRASKLTQVLRDSFISPRARTCMIAMISPGRKSCEHTLNTLRYADRVKELAPDKKRREVAEPAAAAEDEDEDLLEDETPPVGLDSSLAKHDLQQLHKSMRSRGEDEDMDGMFQQLEAMATLEETEDAVIEEHRSAIQFAREMLTEEEKVLAEVEGVNSDSEEYARRLEQILAAKIEKLQHLKANVGKFRRQLQDEEARAKDCKGFKFV